MEKILYYPEFITGTILNWQNLLKPQKYKHMILENLQHMVSANKITLYSYCIMDNHIHLIWQIKGDVNVSHVKRSFFTRTAQCFKSDLKKHHPKVLPHFKSSQGDRNYHFWERRSLGIDLFTDKVFEQKFNYIHQNPVAAGLCTFEEGYPYSSALFYRTREDPWNMLTHYRE